MSTSEHIPHIDHGMWCATCNLYRGDYGACMYCGNPIQYKDGRVGQAWYHAASGHHQCDGTGTAISPTFATPV